MATFTHTIPVQVSADRLWALMCDVRQVAELFPYVAVEDFSAPEDDSWLFWRQLTIPNVAQLRWREQARVTEQGEISFQAVEGDLKTFNGYWRIAPTGDASTLTLALEYAVPTEMAPKLPPAVVQYVMSEVFKSICDRVKEAAEENAG